ncbi:MAG: hypothetical protein QXW28_04065 [Nitrososphaerota archaeon]
MKFKAFFVLAFVIVFVVGLMFGSVVLSKVTTTTMIIHETVISTSMSMLEKTVENIVSFNSLYEIHIGASYSVS